MGRRQRTINLAISRPALWAIALSIVYFAVTVWWLTQDQRVPSWDPGRHTAIAFGFYDSIRAGDVFDPFNEATLYPPLVHLVGAFATGLAGKAVWPSVVASNLIFLPLLVAGCYQTGKLVYGNARAGLLAVIFALGTPMVVGQFHVFMLDVPETALAAVSVWFLLASRRFERIEFSVLAGLAVGLGMLTKQTFPIFVAGLVLVLLARGGWRHWRGVVYFGTIAGALAAPWYVVQFSRVERLAGQSSLPGIAGDQFAPRRFSMQNFEWFFWSGLNYQLLVPLSLFVLAGVVVLIVRRDRRPALLPEVLIGAFSSWLGITLVLSHDPRYNLPMLVYLAVLGTGWIVQLPRRGRLVAQGLLVLIACVNFVGASFGLGKPVELTLPGGATPGSYVQAGQVTLYSEGFVFGKPVDGGDPQALMHALYDEGYRRVVLWWRHERGETASFNAVGLRVLAESAGMTQTFEQSRRNTPDEIALINDPIKPVLGQPCIVLDDGTGLYVRKGDPTLFDAEDACPYDRS